MSLDWAIHASAAARVLLKSWGAASSTLLLVGGDLLFLGVMSFDCAIDASAAAMAASTMAAAVAETDSASVEIAVGLGCFSRISSFACPPTVATAVQPRTLVVVLTTGGGLRWEDNGDSAEASCLTAGDRARSVRPDNTDTLSSQDALPAASARGEVIIDPSISSEGNMVDGEVDGGGSCLLLLFTVEPRSCRSSFVGLTVPSLFFFLFGLEEVDGVLLAGLFFLSGCVSCLLLLHSVEARGCWSSFTTATWVCGSSVLGSSFFFFFFLLDLEEPEAVFLTDLVLLSDVPTLVFFSEGVLFSEGVFLLRSAAATFSCSARFEDVAIFFSPFFLYLSIAAPDEGTSGDNLFLLALLAAFSASLLPCTLDDLGVPPPCALLALALYSSKAATGEVGSVSLVVLIAPFELLALFLEISSSSTWSSDF
mmetsp:Transcript_17896/g.32350  ORF Transcript_17896/g.32350 Transcript_17896/m.32350 type:complete len:424 (+) Transcript_17896:931-2202(+)